MAEAALKMQTVRKRRKHKPTHAVMVMEKDFAGADAGFRCFKLLKTGRLWVYLVETGHLPEPKLRKVEIDQWKRMLRQGGRVL